MKKSLFFWLYFIVAIILAIYFSVRIITTQMGRGPITYVKHVYITGTGHDANLDAVRVAVGITQKTPIKSVDLYQINNRVLGVPGIRDAATRRLPNGDIVIKTIPYDVAAQWSDGVYFYPLSTDGTKIDTPSTERNENTIVFRGAVPNDLSEIIAALSPIEKYIDYVTMVESRRWNIHTKNGMVIYLPEINPETAINKINILNQTHNILNRDIKILDMRDEARILVKTNK